MPHALSGIQWTLCRFASALVLSVVVGGMENSFEQGFALLSGGRDDEREASLEAGFAQLPAC